MSERSGVVRAAVLLSVRDVVRSVAFYRDVIGFEEVPYPGIPLLRFHNLELFLVEDSPPTSDKPGVAISPPADPSRISVVLNIEVEDVHIWHEALVGRGVRFLTPPSQPPWGGWRCFAPDPDGYLIEIEQPA
jgi:catechol 2,3-dioxygenase-like lactoylglutathione lyase family enzyme